MVENLKDNRLASLACAAVAAVLIATLPSCSVKEDRRNCPCLLTVDLSEVDSAGIGSARLDLRSAGGFNQTIGLGSGELGRRIVLEVPRSELFVTVTSGEFAGHITDDGLLIPKGEDCPPVYMHSSKVDARGETASDTVRLHKNFSMLSVGMLSGGRTRPFDVAIRGNVCGFSLMGSPIEGDFMVVGAIPAGRQETVGLPRQLDSSLSLLVIEDGLPVREFALGEYIRASGYDWTAPDLEDIDIMVDFALCEVRVSVQDWETRFYYGVEI